MTREASERLLALARHAARICHDWQFDAAENIDEIDAGHKGGCEGFHTCPHPDCALVRDAAAGEERSEKAPAGSVSHDCACGKHARCPGTYTRGVGDGQRHCGCSCHAAGETHRCSGCGLRWEGELSGAELCGDCWRKAQPVLHAAAGEVNIEAEALRRELNAWREVGEELTRAVEFMPAAQRADLFPDWFKPRLDELLRGARPGLMAAAGETDHLGRFLSAVDRVEQIVGLKLNLPQPGQNRPTPFNPTASIDVLAAAGETREDEKELRDAAHAAISFLRAVEWNDHTSETNAADIAHQLDEALSAANFAALKAAARRDPPSVGLDGQ